jgi:hypothetical protein
MCSGILTTKSFFSSQSDHQRNPLKQCGLKSVNLIAFVNLIIQHKQLCLGQLVSTRDANVNEPTPDGVITTGK